MSWFINVFFCTAFAGMRIDECRIDNFMFYADQISVLAIVKEKVIRPNKTTLRHRFFSCI